MNRTEHLKWSKDRAIQILNRGDITGAYASFSSDMSKHPELQNHIALEMGMMLMFSGNLSTHQQMEDFINGFN